MKLDFYVYPKILHICVKNVLEFIYRNLVANALK